MAKNVRRIAGRIGAKVINRLPDVGGGAFGAARLAAIVETQRRRLVPGRGRRAGRPTDPSWVHHPKVPMGEATERLLTRLAEQASTSWRKVSPCN